MDQTTTTPLGRLVSRPVPLRVVIFGVVLLVYVLLTIGVLHRSPLLTLDQDVFRLDLRQRYPEWFLWLNTYVMLGQRAPATLVALPWFVWRAWKSRSARPLVMLGTALLVLNLTVGVVKVATGRLGPRATHQVNAVFEGGDIFPSGHVSNAVVLYGVIAMLAVSHRRLITAFAVFVSVTVGLSTIYLDTHWMTDVLGGWLAGALVLIVLPWVMPYTERMADVVIRLARRVFAARRSVVPPPRPARTPVIVDRTAASGPRGPRLATGRPNAQPGPGHRPAVAARPGAQA